MKKIIASSSNEHKIKELQAITGKFGMEVISKKDAGFGHVEVEEDGHTFEENSKKKAQVLADVSGEITIADDSGLMVEYLGGEPGVYSARFAGEGASDLKNNEKLLALLDGVPYSKRRAKFVSVITMVFPDGDMVVARGECPGHILLEARGKGGFGYDPLFVPDGYQRTFAQLTEDEKNSISHRAQALKVLEELLNDRK